MTIITKDVWTFRQMKQNQWQVLLGGKHFAFVSTAAVMRGLAHH
jgi:hypothetical protein